MSRVQNNHMTLEPGIIKALDRWVEVDRHRRQTVRHLQELLAPADAERRLGHVVSRHTAQATGIEAGLIHLEHSQQTHKIEQARALLQAQPTPPARRQHSTLDVPQPAGALFWWIRTDWVHTDHFDVDTIDDGLLLIGGLDGEPPRNWLESATPLRAEFEMAAFFQLDAQRLELPATERLVSKPPIAVQGELVANTTREFMPGGRSSTECRLHLSHRIFQLASATEKAEPVIISEAHKAIEVLSETNTGRALREPLPGAITFPAVSFHDIDPTHPLWARIDIRLDLQVEGAGNLLRLDPAIEVILDQWPIQATG